MNYNLIDTFIEVKLPDEEAFLKVAETLQRMGISSHKEKKLTQSCHILHKQGKYYVVHFLELFKLDGRQATLEEEDYGRRNRIALLLESWGLLKIADNDVREKIKNNLIPMSNIKVIPFKEKDQWTLSVKYTIGKKTY